ncbi:DNA primase [Trebonia kvetii]|uniref:DNA primase n=1 Tax=Trebonia kvetii TaxID=2480626 RepID=A0A6P2BR63_9ACTN|nr:DNA primase [Trebonia kvetii]TVZ01358.1 DNA primase [Trebonia kvetii]
MPGRIRQEDIAAVRERSPIADVVGEYLQLRPAGGGHLKGLCPFHEERTPSFNVTPGKELYHCFSCGEGGDVIKFLMKIETLQFGEAIERLAARAGIELRYEQGGYVPGQETSIRRRLIDAHRLAQEFYSERLRHDSATPARAFLAERGFTLADADQFGTGYSPAAWDELTKHLRGRGFTEDELLKSGLSRKTSRGGLIDMFRGRLMWPIRDLTGETIAFGARKLDASDDGPKYLNTPETQIFKKSHVLYGADLAKREIAKRRQAVIVEGYTDVMACHLSGVPTAVATCGTSFGEEHVKVLRRLIMDTDGSSGEVIFTFDGDAAGQKAALRAFALEEKFVTQTFVAVQPDGLDPCDLRLKHGEAAVRDLVARRVPLFEFAIRSVLGRHDLDTREGQFAAIDEAAPIIVRIKDRSKWKQYAVDLDRWIGFMDERYILDRVRHAAGAVKGARGTTTRSGSAAQAPDANGQRRADAGAAPSRPYDRSDPVLRVEREALKLAVQWPALTGPEFDTLGAVAFSVPQHAAVFGVIAAAGGVGTAGRARDWAVALLEAAPDDRARAFVTELATEPLQVAGEPDEKYADVILARVGELAVGREIAAIKARLQRMNPAEDQAGYGRIFGELVGLEQRRKWLLDRATGA